MIWLAIIGPIPDGSPLPPCPPCRSCALPWTLFVILVAADLAAVFVLRVVLWWIASAARAARRGEA